MQRLARSAIRRVPTRLRRPVELVLRTVDAAIGDRLPGLAAEIAFWVVLSLPALLLTGVAVAGAVAGAAGQSWRTELVARAIEVSSLALTNTTIDEVVRPLLGSLIEEGGFGVISFAFVTTVWTASRAVKVVLVTLAIVYGREEARRGWQDRVLGFALTLGAIVVGAILAPLLLSGPGFGDQVASWFGDAFPTDLHLFAALWRALYWPGIVLLAMLAIATLYRVGVPGESTWLRALPGAALATGAWLAGSAGLRVYGAWIVDSGSAYGPLAGPIVFLLWLWLTGFAVLLGGEFNAQLEHVVLRADADDPQARVGQPSGGTRWSHS